jgi:hypothetical protein
MGRTEEANLLVHLWSSTEKDGTRAGGNKLRDDRSCGSGDLAQRPTCNFLINLELGWCITGEYVQLLKPRYRQGEQILGEKRDTNRFRKAFH